MDKPPLLGVLDIEITGKDKQLLLTPNDIALSVFLGKLDLGSPLDVPSDLSKSPSYRYRTDQVSLHLTEKEIHRLVRHDLAPWEFLDLVKKHGVFHEIHDDYYQPETGEAFQPVEL